MSELCEARVTRQNEASLSLGCFTWSAIFTTRCTPYNCSHRNTQTVIAAAVISVSVLLRIATPLSLHRLWDGLITSSNNTRTLRNIAIELQSRFSKASLSELAVTEPEAWAKESFEIATKIAYQNGAFRGTPKGQRKECREVTDAAVLPAGYAAISRKIADRRMMLSGYRLAIFLQRIATN
jgi:hypothetical protein